MRMVMLVLLYGFGLFHALGAVQSWAVFRTDWLVQNPWVFSAGVTLRSTGGRALSLLWVAALVTLLVGTYGLSANRDWFRTLLPAGAALSILAILPWKNVIPEGQHFLLLSVDVLILIVLLFRWQIRI